MRSKIISLLIIILLSFIFYSIFIQATKSVKSKRLECQSKTTTFEKIFIVYFLDFGQNSLLS